MEQLWMIYHYENKSISIVNRNKIYFIWYFNYFKNKWNWENYKNGHDFIKLLIITTHIFLIVIEDIGSSIINLL